MDNDFREHLQEAFKQPSSRFFYVEAGGRHYIACRFTSDDDVLVVETLIETMQQNQGLINLREGIDYQWEGGSIISFTNKKDAAMFYLCCPL